MNITIVTGSHRIKSQSQRIAEFIASKHLKKFNNIYKHYLSELQLPFWDEGMWTGTGNWDQILKSVHSDIKKTDAFIIITPEWSGMVPPMLKNYFLLSGQNIMRHKPALIVSISSGQGGSYPINELRISSYKNTKICFIPDHVILRNVEKLFVNENQKSDEELNNRIGFSCNLLYSYSKALVNVRSENLEFDRYQYGM